MRLRLVLVLLLASVAQPAFALRILLSTTTG